MQEAITETNFHFDQEASRYQGKVRDVYRVGGLLLSVTTDRVSAFDLVLPRAIPHKGAVLNTISAYFLEAASTLMPTWLLAVPHPNLSVGRIATPYPVEMVVRGILAGHAWREYAAGKRMLCGVPMPEGMKENDVFPEPIITPTTKAHEGHDEDISREEIFAQKLVPVAEYIQLEAYSRALFAQGTALAAERGLILVDTKYEFGQADGQIMLIDEVHTPDSSRYFYREGYAEAQAQGKAQRQLSKEFLREWLIQHGFQGLAGQKVPEMTDEMVESISMRYQELYSAILGAEFVPVNTSLPELERIAKKAITDLVGVQ